MFNMPKRFIVGAVPLLLGLGAAGFAAQADSSGASAGPLRCEIQATANGGMIALEGVVRADVPVSGAYSFRVASGGQSGGSNIEQGGGFAAGPDGAVSLGTVMLGGGGIYDATLTITANGTTIECAERIGGAI